MEKSAINPYWIIPMMWMNENGGGLVQGGFF